VPQTPVPKCTTALQAVITDGLLGSAGLTGGRAAAIEAHGSSADISLLKSA
jgi:hypothetical protein